ncbi:unnamed protein product [Soboliphyme baturini]|uniref:Uncharacterized protein n=1 Tax=Soboliphyme baturini TaxID=241478 RepID=A0A183IWK7_9BILA|nr:unnamed protein product [Soboliphyme baturini]
MRRSSSRSSSREGKKKPHDDLKTGNASSDMDEITLGAETAVAMEKLKQLSYTRPFLASRPSSPVSQTAGPSEVATVKMKEAENTSIDVANLRLSTSEELAHTGVFTGEPESLSESNNDTQSNVVANGEEVNVSKIPGFLMLDDIVLRMIINLSSADSSADEIKKLLPKQLLFPMLLICTSENLYSAGRNSSRKFENVVVLI